MKRVISFITLLLAFTALLLPVRSFAAESGADFSNVDWRPWTGVPSA